MLVTEVAFAVALTAAAGLQLRSFVNLLQENRGFDAEMAKQDAASPGILRSHELDLLQDFEGAEGDVVEVADWRRDDVENALRVARHPAILRYHCEMALLRS